MILSTLSCMKTTLPEIPLSEISAESLWALHFENNKTEIRNNQNRIKSSGVKILGNMPMVLRVKINYIHGNNCENVCFQKPFLSTF